MSSRHMSMINRKAEDRGFWLVARMTLWANQILSFHTEYHRISFQTSYPLLSFVMQRKLDMQPNARNRLQAR
jgi:hypothetical protein